MEVQTICKLGLVDTSLGAFFGCAACAFCGPLAGTLEATGFAAGFDAAGALAVAVGAGLALATPPLPAVAPPLAPGFVAPPRAPPRAPLVGPPRDAAPPLAPPLAPPRAPPLAPPLAAGLYLSGWKSIKRTSQLVLVEHQFCVFSQEASHRLQKRQELQLQEHPYSRKQLPLRQLLSQQQLLPNLISQ